METVLRVAVIQTNAGPDLEPNLAAAGALVRQAAAAGARFAALPENVGRMVQGRARLMEGAAPQDRHPGLAFFRDLARDTGLWLMTGTLHCLTDDGRLANRCFVIDDQGRVRDHYDKIHMFDVDLGGGEVYRESATFRPGERAVVVPTPWGDGGIGLGLSVCYDLRFAYLFRALAQGGAAIITVPAAFTVPTGRAHWHVLLRARAIETGCFVLAPAQTGVHDGGRATYGHALIVSPWGEVLADAGEGPGVILADLDLAQVRAARDKVPSLRHDRHFDGP